MSIRALFVSSFLSHQSSCNPHDLSCDPTRNRTGIRMSVVLELRLKCVHSFKKLSNIGAHGSFWPLGQKSKLYPPLPNIHLEFSQTFLFRKPQLSQVHTGWYSLLISAVITNHGMSRGDISPVQTRPERVFASHLNSHHEEGMTEQTTVFTSRKQLVSAWTCRLWIQQAGWATSGTAHLTLHRSPRDRLQPLTLRREKQGYFYSDESSGQQRGPTCL